MIENKIPFFATAISITELCIVCTAIQPVLCTELSYNFTGKEIQKNKNSKNWKIEFVKPKVNPYNITRISCGVQNDFFKPNLERKSRKALVFLKREDQDDCVAVVRFNGDSTISLNPAYNDSLYELDYGSIPILQSMTITDADDLWSPKNKKYTDSRKRSYKLVICDAPYKSPFEDRNPDEIILNRGKYYYYLDFIFSENNLIKKYRVRPFKENEAVWQNLK